MTSARNEPATGGGLTLEAPAKINLLLRVTGRRPDGYHELDTLMAKLSLADRVTMVQRPGYGLRVRVPGTDLPVDGDNLAGRAALRMAAVAGRAPDLEITIDKRIPVAAGLGGGSADAAAVLRGLDTLWRLRLGEERLQQLALELGADVPFLVSPHGVARAGGVGERLTPVRLSRSWWVVLVNPGFAVSTAWVFRNFALTSAGDAYMLGRDKPPEGGTDLAGGELFLHNDLETVTLREYPQINQIKSELRAFHPAGVLMSGSGPTVFALFASATAARRCAAALEGRLPWVAAARLLS